MSKFFICIMFIYILLCLFNSLTMIYLFSIYICIYTWITFSQVLSFVLTLCCKKPCQKLYINFKFFITSIDVVKVFYNFQFTPFYSTFICINSCEPIQIVQNRINISDKLIVDITSWHIDKDVLLCPAVMLSYPVSSIQTSIISYYHYNSQNNVNTSI